MSLIINIATPEGMVMAADSRQTYRNQRGIARIGSDNACKLFSFNDRISVGAAGIAFLQENRAQRNVGDFIMELSRTIDSSRMTVSGIAAELHGKFSQLYNWKEQLAIGRFNAENEIRQKGCTILDVVEEAERLLLRYDNHGKAETVAVGVEPLTFLVAGFNPDSGYEVCMVSVPGEIQKKRDSSRPEMASGATWIGQTDVVSRIILGFDPRIQNIRFINQLAQSVGQDEYTRAMRTLEYIINWDTMTIQDAIDLSVLLIKTTSAIQRFSDGIVAEPGGLAGVGGNIDVMVIKRDTGVSWISRKELGVTV